MALILIIENFFLNEFFYLEFKNKPEISLSLTVFAVGDHFLGPCT